MKIASGLGLLVLAIGWSGPARAEPLLAAGNETARYVGEAVCLGCHSVEAAHWEPTIHARAFRGRPRSTLEESLCEACHGPGSAHVAAPEDPTRIAAFTRGSALPVEQQNAICLQCHRGGARLLWQGSAHESRDLACSDCHNPMSASSPRAMLRERSVNRTCLGCHPRQRAEFRKRSHMPVLEGKMSCADCHAPHGSNTDPLLKGDSLNQVCYACHAEKRGPFLWEHAPVRESCLNCHRPHGSNHEQLLITTRGLLCQQCHSQVNHPSELLTAGNLAGGAAPDARLINRACTNCHAQIHGSNHPSGPRFHR